MINFAGSLIKDIGFSVYFFPRFCQLSMHAIPKKQQAGIQARE
jgi:hypothetical protein